MKLSKECAFAIIRAWIADARIERLDAELQREIVRKHGTVRARMYARTFVGSFAMEASELCFANKFQQAAISLMSTGITNGKSKYEKELNTARTSTAYYEKRKASDTTKTNALYASHRLSEQWGVCK